MTIYGTDPLSEKFTFCLLLLIVHAFHFQNQHCAVCQLHQVVGPEFVNDALERIRNLKANMVVFHPGSHIGIAIKLQRLICLPSAVVDAHINVGALCVLACFARVPRQHVGGGTYWTLGVKDRLQRQRIFEPYRLPQMLDNRVHIQRKHNSAPKIVCIEQRWIDHDSSVINISFHHSHQLCQQILTISFPRWRHLVVNSARSFKDNFLHPKPTTQFLQMDFL